MNKFATITREIKKDSKWLAIGFPFRIKLNKESEWSFRLKMETMPYFVREVSKFSKVILHH